VGGSIGVGDGTDTMPSFLFSMAPSLGESTCRDCLSFFPLPLAISEGEWE